MAEGVGSRSICRDGSVGSVGGGGGSSLRRSRGSSRTGKGGTGEEHSYMRSLGRVGRLGVEKAKGAEEAGMQKQSISGRNFFRGAFGET